MWTRVGNGKKQAPLQTVKWGRVGKTAEGLRFAGPGGPIMNSNQDIAFFTYFLIFHY